MFGRKLAGKVAVGGVVGITAVGAGVAVAAWLQTSTASGSAKATTAVTSTILSATATSDLYPGKTGGSVYFTVNNPNPYPVTFTELKAGSITSSDATNCPATATNITANASVPVNISLPANASATAQTVSGVTNMPGTVVNGCQGVGFTIALTLNGTSS